MRLASEVSDSIETLRDGVQLKKLQLKTGYQMLKFDSSDFGLLPILFLIHLKHCLTISAPIQLPVVRENSLFHFGKQPFCKCEHDSKWFESELTLSLEFLHA